MVVAEILTGIALVQKSVEFIKTNICFKARTSLSAAKKAYRHNKNLVDIFLIDDQNNIYHHVSTTFFTKKKEHKLRR